MKLNKILISVVTIVMLLCSTACDNYNRIVKNGTIDQKYELAIKCYEKEQFDRAITLLEEIITVYRGTAKGERVLFMYCYSNFNIGDYILASYHFKNFVRSFPTSDKAEECAYMSAYCFYLTSPTYSLDQSDSKAAIAELQSFINKYPTSTRVTEANDIVAKLRTKLEDKAYDNAKLYFHIGDYKASIIAINNMLREFPDTKRREELNFLIVKSHYLLTINSIDAKKPERILSTIDAYVKFADKFPKSAYQTEIESIYKLTLALKEKFKV